MKVIRRLLLFVPLLLIASWGLAAPSATTGAGAVDAAWVKAFKANDLEAVMGCYAPDAVVWLPDAPEAKGAQAIRESYQALFSANTVQAVALSETHYATVGNRSIGWGKFSMTMVPKATGTAAVATGRFTVVAEKRGGKWLYTVDHASMNPPPAPKK